MKRAILIITVILSISTLYSQKTTPALEVMQRVIGKDNLSLNLKIKKQGKDTYFKYSVENGEISITASDNIALCRGFYDYIKSNHYGMFSWNGNSINMPESLPDTPVKEVVSPFMNHYYFNVCTYGYTMPYWNWERWEKEIDWMAMHGFNMPLALVGYESIISRVWKKMGLTEAEIGEYFAGPAHLPWMRMGNMCNLDGPLSQDWLDDQVELQHKILKRMKELGMQPICPGFAGFVPKGMKRIHPELDVVETHWVGAFNSWMISPNEPVFLEISTNFIKEWEKEFGKNNYYLIDSFNEMDIPFPAKGSKERFTQLSAYGEKVYNSIKAANPKASWAMQGWMLGYQREIWDFETLEALWANVPDDKVLLIDLAADYCKLKWTGQGSWEYYKGFFDKSWIYSTVPNMGGKSAYTDVLDFYAKGHVEALESPNKGKLIGYGTAPEGIENNEVIYELISDAGWSAQAIDLKSWLRDYTVNRYGETTADILKAWDFLLNSAYKEFEGQPKYNWQLRPGNKGTVPISQDFFTGIETFVKSSDKMSHNPYYLVDLQEMTAMYLAGKADVLVRLIDEQYLYGDTVQARFLESRFETALLGMDAMLQNHPTMRLDRWLDFASKSARNEAQKQQYLRNARRIVTIWGWGAPLSDYSSRIWSGLIKDYYLPRWKHYFDSRKTGVAFDFDKWERAWIEKGAYKRDSKLKFDVPAMAKRMVSMFEDIRLKNLNLDDPNMAGSWSVAGSDPVSFEYVLSAGVLKGLKGFGVNLLMGDEKVQVLKYQISADGKTVTYSDEIKVMENGKVEYLFNLPPGYSANNECTLKLTLKASKKTTGIVLLYPEN